MTELNDDVSEETNEPIEYTDTLGLEDAEFMTDLHIRFMSHCTKTEWLYGDSENKLNSDFVGPLVEKMKLCKQVLENCIDSFDYTFDLKSLNALNVLISVAQRFGDVNLISGKLATFRC